MTAGRRVHTVYRNQSQAVRISLVSNGREDTPTTTLRIWILLISDRGCIILLETILRGVSSSVSVSRRILMVHNTPGLTASIVSTRKENVLRALPPASSAGTMIITRWTFPTRGRASPLMVTTREEERPSNTVVMERVTLKRQSNYQMPSHFT